MSNNNNKTANQIEELSNQIEKLRNQEASSRLLPYLGKYLRVSKSEMMYIKGIHDNGAFIASTITYSHFDKTARIEVEKDLSYWRFRWLKNNEIEELSENEIKIFKELIKEYKKLENKARSFVVSKPKADLLESEFIDPA